MKVLLTSGLLLVCALGAAIPPAPAETARTEAEWEKLCESVLAEKDEWAARKLVDEFVGCTPEDLRKRLLWKIAEDRREWVAVSACEVLALTGVDETDAPKFWKLHEGIWNFRCRGALLLCVGLTGDLDSVKRLCGIAGGRVPDGDRDLFGPSSWMHAAQRAAYMLTGEPPQWVPPLTKNAAERKEVFDKVAKTADQLKAMGKEERSRKLMDGFIARGLAGPCRETAQYALLRLAGSFPIDDRYFLREVWEHDDDFWKKYAGAWQKWWQDNKQKAAFDAKGGYFINLGSAPPPHADRFALADSFKAGP